MIKMVVIYIIKFMWDSLIVFHRITLKANMLRHSPKPMNKFLCNRKNPLSLVGIKSLATQIANSYTGPWNISVDTISIILKRS